MLIKVNLKGIVDKVGVLNKILDELKITTSTRQNFDGFDDYISNLGQCSEIWLTKQREYSEISDLYKVDNLAWWKIFINRYPELESLKLMLFELKEYHINNPKDYDTFLEILKYMTDPKNRADKVIFSYEVYDSEMPY